MNEVNVQKLADQIVMQMTPSLFSLLGRLWGHITTRRRRQFGFLLLLIILASLLEIISIGAVLPFLGVLTAPERIFASPTLQPLIHKFGVTSSDQLLLILTLAFGVGAILAGSMRLLLLWATTRLSYATGADLSSNIYRRTLYQPYAVHVARNSSEIINGIANKTSAVTNTLMTLLTLVGSTVMLVGILFALLAVEPAITLAAFGGFGIIYVFIARFTQRQLLTNSQIVARESTHVIKSLQEGLGGIRDVLIDGSQDAYCKIYRDSDTPLRQALGSTTFISASPRFVMEALGMFLIAVLAYFLARQPDGIARAIPVLGALALGAQRLLPALQQAYSAWASVRGSHVSLQDALELLDQPLPLHADQPAEVPLTFQHEIALSGLSFRYGSQSSWVFRNLSLHIAKGSRVGFVGTTGSGKSTLIDVVMGLLEPSEGVIYIDNEDLTTKNLRAWQARIAHVPQAIFLADSSIEENIAFGVPKEKIDHERVKQAARQAQIANIVESWPNQYQTFVGERGVRLSGGQRQRIGIARALYKQADLIIFDEATSALDSDTEEGVMRAIENLSGDLTILIVAHRLTTLKGCTQIVELGGNNSLRV